MFGEIDCRLNEGILLHHKKTGKELRRVVNETAQSYLEYVIKVLGARDITPIFYGVPARAAQVNTSYSYDKINLSYIISEFNQILKRE